MKSIYKFKQNFKMLSMKVILILILTTNLLTSEPISELGSEAKGSSRRDWIGTFMIVVVAIVFILIFLLIITLCCLRCRGMGGPMGTYAFHQL